MNTPRDTASIAAPDMLGAVGQMLDDGLLVADAGGTLISANVAAVRFLGEGLVGKRLADVIARDEVIDLVAGRTSSCTLAYALEGSVAMEFNVRVQRIEDGQIVAMLLDMTSQRNLERVRRDFVANVSHELRSPLTSLAGFIETILLNEVRDWPTQQRFLKIMGEEAGRMSRLIDDLLSLSRVEVDEHIIPDERVPLLEVVKSVIASLEPRAARRQMGIVLVDDWPSQPNRPVMYGFSDEINEVFHNLIENAIKYGFEGTEIRIDISVEEGGYVRVCVTNTGEAIGKSHLGRLTERFYRVDKARSRQIGGTGLGLAIVKHIVNRHRGTMEITSSDEGVTTFAVSLPVIAGHRAL
ncbi:MAG: ATP-binding protein [Pseudomonadota bacterium]|nr:ATP-binding protein [Pseudomonadota bacterium]